MNELVETNQLLADPNPVSNRPQIENDYKPSAQQALREYEINIRFLSRGCVVRVGCKEIPFESTDAAMAELNAYVANPVGTEIKWREILK
jgi:hypothetical protein